MSVSLSSIPVVLKDRSYQGGMLKGSPARGFYPAPLPGPHHYMDFFPRTHNLLHPLKSLGRLVSDTQTSLPLNLHAGGVSPFLGQGGHHASVLHEHMLSASGFPYLSQMLPGQPLYSKPEELAAVVTEHAAGPLSSDFSSPASERCPSASSSSSSSPPKESLFRLQSAELSQQKTRTSYNFSEDDLFMVLYGYSGSQERNVGHAISGLALLGFFLFLPQAFTASSILRTHIRQHSGERPFKCKHCGKAFASHAAHDSHVRRTHARDKPHPCDLCGATFQEEQELQYHMNNHKKNLDSTVLPSSPGSGLQKDSVFPVKDNAKTQKSAGQNLPYTGLTALNPEYRPWN